MGLLDFFRPAHRHSDPERRLAAVEKLADDEVLIAVARSDPDEAVRIAAVQAVTDPDHLAVLATEAGEADMRCAAVLSLHERKRLNLLDRPLDPALVPYLMDPEIPVGTRCSILRHVDDVDELERLVRELEQPEVRARGVDRLADLDSAESASRVLGSVTSLDDRSDVVRRLRNADVVAAMLDGPGDPDVLVTAVARLLKIAGRGPAPRRLKELASSGSPERVRRIAAFGVDDPAVLEELTSEADPVLRIAGRLRLYAQRDDRISIRVNEAVEVAVSFPKLVSDGLIGYLQGLGVTISDREGYFHHHLVSSRGGSYVEGWTHRLFVGGTEVASIGVSKDTAKSPDFGTGSIQFVALEDASGAVPESADALAVALGPVFARLSRE